MYRIFRLGQGRWEIVQLIFVMIASTWETRFVIHSVAAATCGTRLYSGDSVRIFLRVLILMLGRCGARYRIVVSSNVSKKVVQFNVHVYVVIVPIIVVIEMMIYRDGRKQTLVFRDRADGVNV